MHPRTRKRFSESGKLVKLEKLKNIKLFEPLGYLDFLILMRNSKLILTDSGGIQEEATAPQMRKRVLVTRLSTERQEAVGAGFATVVGTNAKDILLAVDEALEQKDVLPYFSPFGDGHAAPRIVELVKTAV
jgi:UDP-N-acetylglucosamine 2-epimerase (non-hydrolysing)